MWIDGVHIIEDVTNPQGSSRQAFIQSHEVQCAPDVTTCDEKPGVEMFLPALHIIVKLSSLVIYLQP